MAVAWNIFKGGVYVLLSGYLIYRVLVRKTAEEKLRREFEIAASQFASLETFISGAPAALAMFDRDMRYVQASSRWCHDYSLQKSSVIGKCHYDLFPTLPERWKQAHERGLAGELLRGERDRFVSHDGREYWVSWEILPWRNSAGEIAGIIIYAEDVTERRNLEEQYRQAQKMEAVGQLAGGVAHDFNNLLTIVMSYAELIAIAPDTNPKTAERARIILESAKKAAQVTSQLLAFSRRQRQELRVLDVNDVVRDFSRMLPEFIPEDIEIAVTHSQEAALVSADQSQLDQVLMNLVVNAQDAMPQGGRLTVDVSIIQVEEVSSVVSGPDVVPAGQYVRLSICDTGCGMEDSTRRHIFEPFFTTKSGKGTGLGLATVYGIVKQTNGWITVESVVNRGTTFDIYLPRHRSSVKSKTAPADALSSPVPSRARVLLVEDQAAVRAVLEEYLCSQGHEVFVAEDGEAALRHAAQLQAPVQVLLTDVIMPRMRGPELAERLRAIYADLKVIFMSGYSDWGAAEQDLRNAIVLHKPMELAALNESIRKLIES